MNWDEFFGAATLKKAAAEYEHLRKWMVEFFTMFGSRLSKIAELIQFTSKNPSIYSGLSAVASCDVTG